MKREFTAEHKKHISEALKKSEKAKIYQDKFRYDNPGKGLNQTGCNNFNWKGDKAQYHSIHMWIFYRKGRPKKCEHCGATDKKLDWANINHSVSRILSDYIGLCRKCHVNFDNKFRLKTNAQKLSISNQSKLEVIR